MTRKLSAVDLAILRKEKIALPIGTRFNYHGQVMEVTMHTDAEDGTHTDQSAVAAPQTEKEVAPEATSASKSAAEWREEEPADNASQAEDIKLSKEACACEDSEEAELPVITASEELSSIGSPEELSSDNAFLQNLSTQEKAASRKKHDPEENIASEYEGLQKLIDSM